MKTASSKYYFLILLALHYGLCFGHPKYTKAENQVLLPGNHAISLKRALKSKHPEKVKRICVEIDSTSIFPGSELMKFKNLEYIQVIAKNTYYVKFFGQSYPAKRIGLKIDTVRLHQLEHLIYLDFAGFDFKIFPKEICTLRQLKSLTLGVCNIDALPEEISKMKSLEALGIRVNNLSSLPRGIEELDSLKLIDMANNDFHEIPKEVLQMKRLEFVGLLNVEANFENLNPVSGDFPIHMNKINYLNNTTFSDVLKMPCLKQYWASIIYNPSVSNLNPIHLQRSQMKRIIMPDESLRKKIDWEFDFK